MPVAAAPTSKPPPLFSTRNITHSGRVASNVADGARLVPLDVVAPACPELLAQQARGRALDGHGRVERPQRVAELHHKRLRHVAFRPRWAGPKKLLICLPVLAQPRWS
jgi:hypothetical protein